MIKVSGDGQLVQLFYGFTQPLVVQVVDATGRPVAGKTVTWSDVGGINYASPNPVNTDANGFASLQFVAGGDFQPGVGYKSYTVTASSDVGSASFSVVAYPFIPGSFNPQPTVLLLKPAQGSAITMQSGGRLSDAVRVNVVTSGGLGVSPGLPIPGVGLTVRTLNQDPQLGPVASCVGGTVLTGPDGIASCELQASGAAGTTELSIDAGALVTYSSQLTVTPGGATPVILQGNNQTGSPGQTLPLPLSARIVNASGTPVPGSQVQWSVLTPGSLTLVNTQSVSDASGVVSTNVQLGSTPGQYQVRVASGAVEAVFNVTIQGASPVLTITTASLPAGSVSVAYNQSLAAAGGTLPYSWTLASGSLPGGLTLATAGAVTGTPTAAGTFSFVARVTDSGGRVATKGLSLTINTGLNITTPTLPNGVVGAPYSQTLTAAGGTPPYTWANSTGSIVASILPPGLTIGSNGVLAGTPTTAGTYTFTLRVTDAANREAFRSYTVTIGTGVLITTTTLLPGTVGVPYSQTLSVAGGSGPYTWDVTLGTPPAGLTLSNAGVLSGTPIAVGTSQFDVRVRAAGNTTATQRLLLTIGPGSSISITPTTLPNAAVGTMYSQTLAATGGTAPYNWAIFSGLVPPGLLLSPAGVISGTPTTGATYYFTVRARDASGIETTANMSIVVVAGLHITSGSPLPDGTAGSNYSQVLTAAGGNGTYTWLVTSGALPAGLTLSNAGILSGIPAAAGTSNFTVRVSDANGATASTPFVLTINATGSMARAGVISQIASGGGWKTTINLVNTNLAAAPVRIALTAEDGNPLELPYVLSAGGSAVTAIGSVIERTMAANSSLLVEIEGQDSTTVVGWADVRSNSTVSGYAIFRQRGGDGRDQEGTSPVETQVQQSVIVPFDNLTGYSTGVALVNLATSQTTITAIMRDENGSEIARDTLTLAGSGHTSFSMPERFPMLSGRRGTVEFLSAQAAGITALGLRFSPSLSFTSIPVSLRP